MDDASDSGHLLTAPAYCMIVNERVDRIAYTVSNIVTTQQQTISLPSPSLIRSPAGGGAIDATLSVFGAKGVVIVTSIYKPAGTDDR